MLSSRGPSHLPRLLVVLVAQILVMATARVNATCGGGEWMCGGDDRGGGMCISLNKFCDGIEHCDDGTDEPLGCTNCNRTFYGEANVKYPLRVTGPFQRYLPFVCQISFVAGGKQFGDFVELTFLSFQIGRVELTRNQTPICEKGYLKISEILDEPYGGRSIDDFSAPPSYQGRFAAFYPKQYEEPVTGSNPNFGQFCGSMTERSVTFFSQSNNVSVTAVVPSRESIPSTSFGLYLTYRFLRRNPLRPSSYLGHRIPNTYCDRQFADCHGNRKCKIQTPNFPGFYPRNITCQFHIKQPKAPEGYSAKIILSQTNDYKISVPTGRRTSTGGSRFLLSTDCISGDSIRIMDGPTSKSPQLLEFCGSGSLPEIVSSGNEVLVLIRSAPYQYLTNSRVEIDVSVRFEMVQAEIGEDNARCSYTIDGTNRRWGVIHSPRHTMPPNANCTYRLIGTSNRDRVWLYFTSFFVLVEKKTASTESDAGCSVSKLEIYDFGNLNGNSSGSLIPEPTHLFCGETLPRLCAHAADYPPMYLPPRPCELHKESYLSSGSELIIRHRFLSFTSELLTSSTSSFTARYEFIDVSQQGTPIDHSECNRRLDSRLAKRGLFTNPRNVFLYGRGGRKNISCFYHFVGLPSERVRITIRKIRLKTNFSSCRPYFDALVQKHSCHMNYRQSHEQQPSWAVLGATEFWDGHSATVGCICDVIIDSDHQPVILESVLSNVKFKFEVVGMTHLEDFEDYNFEAEYEFINFTTCKSGLRKQTGPNGDGFMEFHLSPRTQVSEVPSSERQIRCRWQIEASPQRHLYLKFRGLNASLTEECRFGSRLLVYLDPRKKPVANACVDNDRHSAKPDDLEEFDIFSHTWYNESRGSSIKSRDTVFIEMVAPPRSASFVIHWLEVTRPFVRTQSGQTMRNVDCLFECPEIGACIDPELWCDGAKHCPSGFDESPEHCKYFPVTYVSCTAAGVMVCVVLVIYFTIRRRRIRRLIKKKDIRQLPSDTFCIESPVG